MNKKERQRLYELKKRNPWTAALLSVVFVGAGQLYNREWAKALIFFFCSALFWLILLGWAWWIVSIIDAYQTVKKQNEMNALELGVEYD